jgi:hypothetical protein
MPMVTASRGPRIGKAYPLLEAPGHVCFEAQALPRVEVANMMS